MGKLIKYEFRKDSGTYLTLFGILVVTEIYFLISFYLKAIIIWYWHLFWPNLEGHSVFWHL